MIQDSNTNVLKTKRRSWFAGLGLLIILCAVSFLVYYKTVTSKHVTTDNAYVSAEIAQVNPAVSGLVKQIYCKDTDVVKKGDILLEIDDTDAHLALARTKAELKKAQADLDRAQIDWQRRASLAGSGSVSEEEVSNARNALDAAQAHVDLAQAVYEQTRVDLERTTIRSPVDGVIAKRQVQLGQRVNVGTLLMSVVPVQNLHVNANFKEVQLTKVKMGQPVKLIADFYGDDVIFHGKISGIAAGTGAAFAVIPAQNATGNWIKVVQRLPVRIELDPDELKTHPLQVGLSMYVDVDISHTP